MLRIHGQHFQRFRQRAVIGLAYLLAYLVFDFISFVEPYGSFGITPWNPPPGLSLALVYLGGTFYVPFVLIAPGLADFVMRGAPLGFTAEVLTSVAVGMTYASAGLALLRLLPFDPRLGSVRDVLAFCGVATAASAVAALLYTGILSVTGELGRGEFTLVVWRFFVGDLIGMLVVAPPIFLAWTLGTWPKAGRDSAFQLAAIIAALVIVFGYRDATAFQLFYLLFLPLLWVALSHGTAGSAVALVIIQLGLVLGAEVRFGNDPGLGALQVLMITLAFTGLVVGAVVTERETGAVRSREQQSALNRALRLRSAGEIAAAIAHEINQPLTAIRTYASVAAKALNSGDRELLGEAVSKLDVQSERAALVLKGIRDLLRKGTLNRQPLDIGRMLRELSQPLKADLADKRIWLRVSVPADFPKVMADGVQLSQAVHNLVNNSADAIVSAKHRGDIRIAVARDGSDRFSIEVSDNGPGFPAGYNFREPMLFVTTKPEGTGIGLSVVRTIAEVHGGTVSISSALGRTSVRLLLPLIEVSR
jgi:two-component system, LuxR family, sensor kinase FixL